MEALLPYKSVVLFIAFGAMVFLIVFVFAKRQITRFAVRSNRVPHAAIGARAPKSLRQEIEVRLRRVEDIKYEPQLLTDDSGATDSNAGCHFYYRMRAVDALKRFDEELKEMYPSIKRCHGASLRAFLLDQQLHSSGSLYGIQLEVIDKFAQMYEHARHDPVPFQQEQYQEFMDLLNHLIVHVKKQCRQGGVECTDGYTADTEHVTLLTPDRGTEPTVSPARPTNTISLHSPESDSTHNAMKQSDSGMFLLTARHSGSSLGSQCGYQATSQAASQATSQATTTSQGSTIELETRFRPSGVKTGGESYV